MTLDEFIRDGEARLRSLKLDRPPLRYVCETGVARDRVDGLWLEFGTGSGATAKVMCRSRQHGQVFSFDWFEGLPDDWLPAYGINRGYFAQSPPTDLPDNATIVVGRFEDTLEPFLAERPHLPVDLLHIDCDLYQSTRYVLQRLTPRLGPGTVMVFDELFYYPTREQHEAKALYEWLVETKNAFEWIGNHGDRSAVDVVLEARAEGREDEVFVGPDRNIIGTDVPLQDRVALVLR